MAGWLKPAKLWRHVSLVTDRLARIGVEDADLSKIILYCCSRILHLMEYCVKQYNRVAEVAIAAIFATNASFLHVITNLQIQSSIICNIYICYNALLAQETLLLCCPKKLSLPSWCFLKPLPFKQSDKKTSHFSTTFGSFHRFWWVDKRSAESRLCFFHILAPRFTSANSSFISWVSLYVCLCLCLFVGQAKSPHHFELSKRSLVARTTLQSSEVNKSISQSSINQRIFI